MSAKKNKSPPRVHHRVDSSGFVRHYVAKDAVVCVLSGLAKVKLCRISFGGDGSVYVSFPYMKAKRGVVSRLETPDGPQLSGSVTYDLMNAGVVVETDVKFSHHRSGETHFSRTGLEQRLPEQQSLALDDGEGSIFELNAFWLGGFKWIEKKAERDLYLQVRFDGPHPFAVRVQGRWWRKSDVEANTVASERAHGFIGPRAEAINRMTGQQSGFFLIAPPDSPFANNVLAITIDRVALPTGADRPTMVFLGGKGDGAALVFLYPYDGNRGERAATV